MHYFAGLFDADGYISLSSTGSFAIAMEKSHKEVIELFKNTFGGSLYERKRKGKKKSTYTWQLIGGSEKAIEFIDKIAHHCIIKKNILMQLRLYLDQTRDQRRQTRDIFSRSIKIMREYPIKTKDEMRIPTYQKPTTEFIQWFAGFMDGDGNFTVFEYQNGPRRTFDSWIGAFNTCPEVITYIKSHIDGSISSYKGIKFPIWKWACSQKESISICDSLIPFLIARKKQCMLVREYLTIHEKRLKGFTNGQRTPPISETDTIAIREIIKQIKHLNSL